MNSPKSFPVIQYLLEQKANVNSIATDGTTLLIKSILIDSSFSISFVQKLIACNADVNYRVPSTQKTVLHFAYESLNLSVGKLHRGPPIILSLLEAGANNQAKSFDNRSPRDLLSSSAKIILDKNIRSHLDWVWHVNLLIKNIQLPEVLNSLIMTYTSVFNPAEYASTPICALPSSPPKPTSSLVRQSFLARQPSACSSTLISGRQSTFQ